MASGFRRKCRHCLELFRPDARNRRHQRYCSAPACKAASKAASQAHWLAKPENQHYFCGPVHVSRVQAWRQRHPDYWRRAKTAGAPLQDLCLTQSADSSAETGKFVRSPLQEVFSAQPAVLIGLIAHIVGEPLQEDIALATRRLLQLGQDILAADAGRLAPVRRGAEP